MLKKYTKQLRILIPLLVVVVITIGFMTNAGIGTLSAIGWFDVALLCPLGALTTMLASKLFVPQAAISLVFGILFMILAGRLFCAWICPIPLVQKVSGLFKKKAPKPLEHKIEEEESASPGIAELVPNAEKDLTDTTLSESSTHIKTSGKAINCSSDCSTCASKSEKIDARHFVLGGSLLSAAVFGFPVFCLVCPIGLSFATIVLLIRLFSDGDVTLSIIIVPLLLLVEVVLFKKWCHKLCPLSAFMSLFGKLNKTLKPQIDDTKCIETSRGVACGLCGEACEESIDPRHPACGKREMNECTRCRACVDACPANAITLPFLPKKRVPELKSNIDKTA